MSGFPVDFRLNRRLYIFYFLNLIVATVVGIRLFFPQAVPALASLIPDPIGVALQIITIFLIISPVLDWINKPRIEIHLTAQTPSGGRDLTTAQVINWGGKMAGDVNIRVFQGFMEPTNQIEILEGGRLLGLPNGKRSGSDVKFYFDFVQESRGPGEPERPEEFEIRWDSEKKDGFRIVQEPNSVAWKYFRSDIIGIVVTWKFNGRAESLERRFRINQAPSKEHPRLEGIDY